MRSDTRPDTHRAVRTPIPRPATPAFAAALACALALATAGCSKPKAPDHDDPPQPQASATAASSDAQGAEPRDTIRPPIERAEAARQTADEAAQRQREAIDAATGG